MQAATIYPHGDSITFTYDETYIATLKSYNLFPSLPRTSFAPFHFVGLGSFSDSAPDRWGRSLINRTLKRNRVSEIEYLGGDAAGLWRRAVFGVAIGNLDNHLRNHAFLMTNRGWQLSPAFDMDPEPVNKESDVYQLSLFGEDELTLKNFITKKALELFGVTQEESEHKLGKPSKVLNGAIREARSAKLDSRTIETIAPRFQLLDIHKKTPCNLFPENAP